MILRSRRKNQNKKNEISRFLLVAAVVLYIVYYDINIIIVTIAHVGSRRRNIDRHAYLHDIVWEYITTTLIGARADYINVAVQSIPTKYSIIHDITATVYIYIYIYMHCDMWCCYVSLHVYSRYFVGTFDCTRPSSARRRHRATVYVYIIQINIADLTNDRRNIRRCDA